MKSRIVLITASFMLFPLLAGSQNIDDALRYSKIFYQGTARFSSMGGAFTALGGDMAAIALNPAGAAVFRSTELALSPDILFRNLNTDYNGFDTDNSSSNFSLGQAGVVSSVKMGSGSGLTGLSFAYTYNRTNNFFRNAVIDGISETGSMTDFWALQANGTNTWNLQNAPYMAYDAWLIDTLPGEFTKYASIFSYYGETDPVYGQKIKRTIDNSGQSGEHTIALATNIGNKIYVGAGFGLTTLSYTGRYVHREMDDEDLVYDFVDLTYTDHFRATGSGWNFKLGAIFRPVESLRLGVSFTTPSIYVIDELFYSNLSANLYNEIDGAANPQIDMDEAVYRYRLTTPYRINAGAAWQFGNFALLSADYEFVDYASARLSKGSDGYDFYDENQDIRSELRSTGNLRLGAEARLGSFYLRGGYRLYGSSFQSGTLNEEFFYSGFSSGIGYRQKNFYFDISMAWLGSSEAYMMFPDDPRDNPLYRSDPTYIHSTDKNITATVGLKF